MPNVTVEAGVRQGSKIYHVRNGYYYHVNRRIGPHTLSLRCIKYYSTGCRARATCSMDLHHFKCLHHHTGHLRDKALPSVLALRRKILDRCLSRDPTRYVQIVEQEGVGFSRNVRSQNTAVKLRSAMRRARLRFLPNVPHDLSELDVILRSQSYKHLTLTLDGKGHMYAGRCGSSRSRSRCLIFMSKAMRSAMATAKNIFCDSTWDGRPAEPPSSQVFSITTTWDHQIIPLCVCLMESKKQLTYVRLLSSISRIVPSFRPQQVNCDFEMAQYNAFREIFPEARVAGCLYHYSNNVSKYARGLGYTDLIKESKIFASLVRSCLAIPLVPQAQLQDALKCAMERADLVFYYDRLEPLFQYIYEQWILLRGHVLSVCDSADRTSNVAESFNAKLQLAVVENRPNVFQFIDGLLKIEERAKQDIYCCKRGISTNRPRKVSAIKNDKAIKRLGRLLKDGHITMMDFLKRASYRLLGPFQMVFPEDSDDDNDGDED